MVRSARIWFAVKYCTDHRTRADATDTLATLFETERDAGRRVLAGFDFPFAYPGGFAEALTGTPGPLRLWEALAARIEDAPDNANNRFQVAAELNDLFPGIGPFWGCPESFDDPRLPSKRISACCCIINGGFYRVYVGFFFHNRTV